MIKENYHIEEIPYKLAMDMVIENHYLHRKCPCSKAFGLFENGGGYKGRHNLRRFVFVNFTERYLWRGRNAQCI